MNGRIIVFLCALVSLCAHSDTLPVKSTVVKPTDRVVSLSRSEQVFENSPSVCAKNATCNLKRVIFRKEDYQIPPSDDTLDGITIQSTRTFAGMITDEVPHLMEYSFVQFTRGCMWYSYKTSKGDIATEFGVVRDFLGVVRLQHIFPDWVVDTNDVDPVYGADVESGNRHYFLQTALEIPTWIPIRKGRLVGEEEPTIPFGYVTDLTGPAYYSPALEMATNMSLEFKTCLFKTADVPLRTNGIDVDIGKAIVCFSWDSKFVFDHQILVYKSPEGIHSACRRPFEPHEKNVHLRRFDPDGEIRPDDKK